jgi:filamentous hemagglutinin family protein
MMSLGATPQEPVVIAGDVHFDSQPNVLRITTSDKAIINWKHFSIDKGETVQFLQPQALSVVLNRVVTGSPSELLGRLEANGYVYLINPNGIFVGENATINTNSFFAFAFDIPNDRFLEHDFTQAPLLASMDFSSDNPFASIIRHEGKIDAVKCEERGGHVYLVAKQVEIDGKIEAPQGDVQILGQGIYLSEQSSIDVSAVSEGDSGNVTILGVMTAQFYGRIDAKGGALSGNGGDVEVSGKQYLDYRGIVDARAPFGKTGTLLLDPTNVTISFADNSAGLIPGPVYNIDAVVLTPANISTMMPTTLIAQLAVSNVVISTAATPGLGDAGDITIMSIVSWPDTTTLSLVADNDIIFQNLVSCTGSGGINLTAGRNIVVGSATSAVPTGTRTVSGNIVASANNDITVFGGNVVGALGGFEATGSGNVSITAGNDLAMAAGSATGAVAIVNANSGNVEVSNFGGNILLTGGLAPAVSAFANIGSATGNVSLIGNQGTLTLQGGTGDFGYAKIGARLGNSDTSGSVILDFEGDIFLLGNPSAPAASNPGAIISSSTTLTSVSTAGNLTLDGGGMASGGQGVFIESSDGAFIVNVGGDLVLRGGTGSDNGVEVVGSADSDPNSSTTINVAGNLILEGGPGTSSDVRVGSFSNCTDSVRVMIDVGNDIVLSVAPGSPMTVSAEIRCEDGSLTVAAGGSITVGNQTRIQGTTCAINDLPITIAAGNSLTLSGNGFIRNQLIGGSLTIILDGDFSKPPHIGSGALTVGAASSISTTGGPLLIFTARQDLNSIQGMLNGLPFVPGTPYVNTATEMWGVYYPHNSGFPYTLFYKDILVSSNVVTDFNQVVYEFLQVLGRYDVFGFYLTPFTVTDNKESMHKGVIVPTVWDLNGQIRSSLVE